MEEKDVMGFTAQFPGPHPPLQYNNICAINNNLESFVRFYVRKGNRDTCTGQIGLALNEAGRQSRLHQATKKKGPPTLLLRY